MECIQILNQSEILGKKFTMYGTKEEPLFVAKDVAEWIEHSNPTEMIRNIDEDEKLNSTIFSAGQKREVSLLTENGLYEVLMQSRKSIAKQFKKEVKAILKQIRLTGGYIPVKQEDDDKIILAKAVSILQKTLDLKETQILELKPKADLCDSVIQSQGYVSFNVLAKSLRVGRNKLMNMLREKKILFKEGRNSLAYQYYCDKNYFKINYGISRNGKICGTTVVSPTGIKYIADIIHNTNLEVAK
jgi:prophage antirepressor-like protein